MAQLAVDRFRFKLDEEWHEAPGGVTTFGGLEGWVLDRLRTRGRVLLGTLHGEAGVTPGEAGRWRGRLLGEFGTLEFLSAEPRALARRTCRDMAGLLDRLGQRAQETAEAVDAGDRHQALLGIRDCAEGWSFVLQSLRDLLRFAGADPSAAEIEGRPLIAVAKDLGGVIERMGGQVSGGDLAGVKDVLLYDLGYYILPMREGFERIEAGLD
ncbi:MAG: hypothetical protein AABZ64_08480 [Nitrospinota bacterium]